MARRAREAAGGARGRGQGERGGRRAPAMPAATDARARRAQNCASGAAAHRLSRLTGLARRLRVGPSSCPGQATFTSGGCTAGASSTRPVDPSSSPARNLGRLPTHLARAGERTVNLAHRESETRLCSYVRRRSGWSSRRTSRLRGGDGPRLCQPPRRRRPRARRYALALRGSAPLYLRGSVTQIRAAPRLLATHTLTWRHAHRVVVLVDVRRSTRDWVDGVVGARRRALGAHLRPARQRAAAHAHVSVVLGARLGAPTRVLVQNGGSAWASRRRRCARTCGGGRSAPPRPTRRRRRRRRTPPPHGLRDGRPRALLPSAARTQRRSPCSPRRRRAARRAAPRAPPADVSSSSSSSRRPRAEAPLGLLADADAAASPPSAGGVLLRCPPPPPRGSLRPLARRRRRGRAPLPHRRARRRRRTAAGSRCRRRRCGRSRRRSPPTSRRRGPRERSARTSCRAASPSPTLHARVADGFPVLVSPSSASVHWRRRQQRRRRRAATAATRHALLSAACAWAEGVEI